MEKLVYEGLDETLYRDTLENGLRILISEKPGFSGKCAYFVTDYGAMDREFTLDGKKMTAPAGVAHYLEHKMFDMPEGDITGAFAALGAYVNAFTSYDMTAYQFSCTDHFEECLELLLKFVSTGYFTEESVAKEQGIIGQEIDMNVDSPDTRVFESMLEEMYAEHPIRVPILGTRETIAQITPQVLYDCHRAFYDPGNMLLCVVGDVDPEKVRAIAEATLPAPTGIRVEHSRNWPETMTCRNPRTVSYMEVSRPVFQLGFKCEAPGKGEAGVREEVLGEMAAEILFGESSDLFLRLYEEGIIDGSFGGGFETLDSAAMLLCSGESEEADRIRKAILEEAGRIVREGIREEDFLRMKRSALGRRVRGLDSFDSVCFRLSAYALSDYDYFRFPEVYSRVTRNDVEKFIERVVRPERCVLSLVLPEEEEKK